MREPLSLLVFALAVACDASKRPDSVRNNYPDVGASPDTAPVTSDVVDASTGCRPGAVFCEAQTPYRCVDGARVYEAPCAGDRPFCVAGTGCLACPPRGVRCSPERADVPQRCADDGSRWIDQAACDASSGKRCNAGYCSDPCAVSEGGRQYLGCDYWATATPNSSLYSTFPFAVALANPHPFPVEVHIGGGALATALEETLNPGEARAVELPWVDALVQLTRAPLACRCRENAPCPDPPAARSALARGGAYQIHATAPVAAYQFNPLTFEDSRNPGTCAHSFSNDASLLLSQASLTQRYLVLTEPYFAPYGGFIAVVATTGPTTVTVRLPRNHGVSEAVDDTVRREGIAAGDVALLVGDRQGDLSGSLVEASAPVAVFVGHDCTYVPQTRPACDHLEEQLLPVETLGHDYVVADLRDRDLGSLVRMVAPNDGTLVEFDPPEVARPRQLMAREVFELEARGSFRIHATGPLLVAQFMVGLGEADVGAGDPAMVFEVPVQQFRDRYDLLVPDTYTGNHLALVVPRGARALLDEAPLTASVESLGPWSVLHATVSPGRHTLRTQEGVPLGVKVYGTARYTSYMYSGGLNLRPLPPG